jgi:hypothetical protein
MEAAATLTKGEFATAIGVSAARVSQMISEGKISGPALVGEGRAQRIDVELAKSQIRARRDVGQALGNGLDTRLDPLPLSSPSQGGAAAPAPPAPDPITDELKAERLISMRLRNTQARREEAIEAGRYVRADQAAASTSRAALTVLNTFEGALADTAQALAAKFNLPARDVLHELRAQFRSARGRAADALRQAAAGLPGLVDDEVADATDPAQGEA